MWIYFTSSNFLHNVSWLSYFDFSLNLLLLFLLPLIFFLLPLLTFTSIFQYCDCHYYRDYSKGGSCMGCVLLVECVYVVSMYFVPI
uniref:Uncharacterized protein n=1 Tax=Rhizophagus irregularis (strain DAOM 181602 / DAOM 197198 / MUCL 43194) TaxID=747089 RepID=U9SY28_RHIID